MKTIEIKGKRVPIPWLYSKTHSSMGQGTIVSASDDEFFGNRFSGGHIVCCSIPPAYQPLIVASPQLFIALKNLVDDVSNRRIIFGSLEVAAELIEELKATP